MANTTGQKFGGRKKGTPNKDTAQLRERIENLLEDNWDEILEDMKQLSPKDRIDTYTKLLEYALPKLSRMEASIENDMLNEGFPDLTSLTTDELLTMRNLTAKMESKNFHPVTIFEIPDNGRN